MGGIGATVASITAFALFPWAPLVAAAAYAGGYEGFKYGVECAEK